MALIDVPDDALVDLRKITRQRIELFTRLSGNGDIGDTPEGVAKLQASFHRLADQLRPVLDQLNEAIEVIGQQAVLDGTKP